MLPALDIGRGPGAFNHPSGFHESNDITAGPHSRHVKVIAKNNHEHQGLPEDSNKRKRTHCERGEVKSLINPEAIPLAYRDSNHQAEIDRVERRSKKLSFYRDEDDDFDDSSDSSRVSPVATNKWISDRRNVAPENSESFPTQIRVGTDKSKFKAQTLVDKVNSNDDAVSTISSCRSEANNSVTGRSDEIHEDLDYDEDSVTNSPPRAVISHMKAAHTTPTQASSSGAIGTTMGAENYGGHPESTEGSEKHGSLVQEHVQTSTSHEIDGNGQQNQTRIKSFINFNHSREASVHEPVANDIDEKVLEGKAHKSHDTLLRYFFKDACYFQIKSINHENVEISKQMGVWSTPAQNEVRLNAAFREHRNVILIFSVQQSGAFQGFARMTSESRPATKPVPWVLPERLSNRSFGSIFKVEWLCMKKLAFHATQDLHNPFNGNKPIKVARDGQQVEPKVGKKLCKLFPHDSKRRLLLSIATLKRQTSQRKKSSQRQENFYPLPDKNGHYEGQYSQAYAPMPPIEPSFQGDFGPNYFDYGQPVPAYRVGGRGPVDYPIRSMYRHQEPCLNHPSSARPYYPPRNIMNGMPQRYMMPSGPDHFYLSQGYSPPMGYQYPSPGGWSMDPESGRFHPNYRARR